MSEITREIECVHGVEAIVERERVFVDEVVRVASVECDWAKARVSQGVSQGVSE